MVYVSITINSTQLLLVIKQINSIQILKEDVIFKCKQGSAIVKTFCEEHFLAVIILVKRNKHPHFYLYSKFDKPAKLVIKYIPGISLQQIHEDLDRQGIDINFINRILYKKRSPSPAYPAEHPKKWSEEGQKPSKDFFHSEIHQCRHCLHFFHCSLCCSLAPVIFYTNGIKMQINEFTHFMHKQNNHLAFISEIHLKKPDKLKFPLYEIYRSVRCTPAKRYEWHSNIRT